MLTFSHRLGFSFYLATMIDPLPEWVGYGDFSIKLRFDDETYSKDIFYFCHVSEL
jgi:hypothetical protein